MGDPDVTAMRTVLVDAMVDWAMPEAEKAVFLRQFDQLAAQAARVEGLEVENRQLRARQTAMGRIASRAYNERRDRARGEGDL